MDGLDVVVVGAGIGGLGSALALARGGNRVTLVERDDTPMPPDAEAAFDHWDRTGAPQVRHPHVFLGLARTILRDRFPDVQRALSELGVEPAPVRNNQGMTFDEATLAVLEADDDLRMLPCRRTTFEWVMRRTVLAEAGVDLVLGRGVAGVELRPSADGPPTVTGVRLDDGEVLPADLVVATTGRRGDVPAWLDAHSITISETVGDCGVVYFSRFYRSDHDEQFGFRGGFGAGLIAGVIGSDAGTYSITAVVDRADKELRAHLNDSARFDASMRLLPELADVAAIGGVPIHPVHCMTGLVNRTRSFTDTSGTPLVRGLVACGDAHTCTNPAYGRGQSLALRQAIFIADAVADHDDVLEAARAYEAASAEQVAPWYQFSVLTDQMRAAASGNDRVAAAAGNGDAFAAVFANVGRDPELLRLVMRVMNLLELPQVMLEKLPQLAAEAPAAASPRPRGPKVVRPSRDDLLAVVA
ncbi:MAG TPA: FAD-dependent oxidoreductase [Microthrixaceae bacterium]|nr:FAD-dependent oxidoreductase [Microthrixaceae bacterium]